MDKIEPDSPIITNGSEHGSNVQLTLAQKKFNQREMMQFKNSEMTVEDFERILYRRFGKKSLNFQTFRTTPNGGRRNQAQNQGVTGLPTLHETREEDTEDH